jgi:hypothetical protein
MASTRVTAADVQITGILDMRSYNMTGLDTNLLRYPTAMSDGATKIYVDEQRDVILAKLDNIDNGSF